jgi:hypothetical protein
VAGSRGSRSADRDEPNRVLGFPLSKGSRARHVEPRRDREAGAAVAGKEEHGAAHDTEHQRVLGFRLDWFRSARQDRGLSRARPLQTLRRRLRRP